MTAVSIGLAKQIKDVGGDLDASACGEVSVLLKGNADVQHVHDVERRLVESWAIQALGTTRRKICDPCKAGKGIYKDCRTVNGLLDGVCGNCKRRERCGECNHSEVFKEALREQQKTHRFEMKHAKYVVVRAPGKRATKAPKVYCS